MNCLMFRCPVKLLDKCYALVGECGVRGTLQLYELVGEVVKVGEGVDVYAMVGITPRSE